MNNVVDQAVRPELPPADAPSIRRSGILRNVLVPPLAGLLIGSIFVAVYLAAFHDPRPHSLPIAVVAPDRFTSAVETQSADNDDAFAVLPYASAAEARSAVRSHEVYGAVIATVSGIELAVAGANGPSVTETLQTAFESTAEAAGTSITVTDLQPLTPGDSRGLSVFYSAFGVVLAAFLFGLTSMQLAPRLRAPWRLISVVAFAALAGGVIAFLVQPVFAALPAPVPVTALIVGLLALAVGSTTIAFLKFFGPAGTFISSVVLLVFGNATSTGILPAQFLPAWLEPLTAILPVGVAVRALRGAAYFQNDGVTAGIIVLAGWVVGAIILYVAGVSLERRRRRPSRAAAMRTVVA